MFKKNSKGFTMIEVITAIIIMGVLLMIAVPNVSKLMKQFRADYYSELEKTITASAKDFYTDNKIYRPDGLLKSSYTSIDSLIRNKYVEKLVDYKGKTCSLGETQSYVVVIYRGKDKYEYKTCIQCPGDDYSTDTNGTYCDPAWLTNNNIKYDFDVSDNLYVYYGTAKEEIREKLLKTLSIVKYNKKNEELEKVPLADAIKADMLPINIDDLDTLPILDSSNKKETTLHYNIDDISKNLNVTIYKHKTPKVELQNAKGEVYNEGDWTNKLLIKLSTNDDFFKTTNTKVANFQWYVDGSWKNITCHIRTDYTCTVAITTNVNKKYKFRLVTNEEKISDESREYSIQVDVTPPKINIQPNGNEEIIVTSGNSGYNLAFSLNSTDEGGSGVVSKKYAINTSKTTAPTTFTAFTANPLQVTKWYPFSEGEHYVWAKVVDGAGNESTGVFPSNVFKVKYEVKYHFNGGTGTVPVQYKNYDSPLSITFSKPTRKNYTFQGWSTSSKASVAEYKAGSNYTKNEPVTLYAIWKGNEYTVSFDGNGGLVHPGSKTVTYGSSYGALPVPTRTDYTFAGWFNEPDGGYKIEENTRVTYSGGHTLYAHWINSSCESVQTSWGNTSEYSSVRFYANGSHILKIYYKKSTDSDYGETSFNPFVYQNPNHYLFQVYAEDAFGIKETKAHVCSSKYDDLSPYTPYVTNISPGENVKSISENCTGHDSSMSSFACTITATKQTPGTAQILVYTNSRDHYSTSASGASGFKEMRSVYIYKDNSTCTETSANSGTCDNSWVTLKRTAVDYAGNVSKTLTINLVWK